VPLCADSKEYYERYCPYSLIDGELATTSCDVDDSSAVDQQTSDADQLMLTDDSKSSVISRQFYHHCMLTAHFTKL